jgi:hypothetical protein
VLRWQWRISGERLRERLTGLTDEEFLWEPVPGAWNLYPDPAHPGGWSYPYEPDPDPAPVTTIAWRLVHIAAGNWIYTEHAFGPGLRNFPDLVVPSRAQAGIGNWLESRVPVTTWLEQADDTALAGPRPSHLGGTKTAAEVIQILIDEQTHHGAEIALLRDLYRWRTAEDDQAPTRTEHE